MLMQTVFLRNTQLSPTWSLTYDDCLSFPKGSLQRIRLQGWTENRHERRCFGSCTILGKLEAKCWPNIPMAEQAKQLPRSSMSGATKQTDWMVLHRRRSPFRKEADHPGELLNCCLSQSQSSYTCLTAASVSPS